MSRNTRTGEELKLRQRWEFRRNNEPDSSSNDSRASSRGEPALKKHNLVSNLSTSENDEAIDGSRFQLEVSYNPSTSAQTKSEKAKREQRAQRGRSKKDHSSHNELKKGPNKQVNQRKRKSKTISCDQTSMDDLKNHMNSMIEGLKAARENLSTWMREEVQKLVAEELASCAKRREGSFARDKIQLEHQNEFDKNEQNMFGKNMQVHHQNIFDKHGKRQQQCKSKENICLQQTINFEDNVAMQHQKECQDNIQLQPRNNIRSRKSGQNSDVQSTRRSDKANESYNIFSPAIDYSQAIVPFTPTKKDGEERLASSAKSNSKSSPSDQTLQEQHQKSIVLGIRAQNFGGSSEKTARAKRTLDYNNPHPVPEDEVKYGQSLGSIVSSEKGNGERFGISLEPSFLSDPFGQVASSMYLTLPTIVKNNTVSNHRLEPSFNCIQQRVAGNQAVANSEKSSLLLGSSSQRPYLQAMQPEDSVYGGISHFNQNSAVTPIVGSGFPFQLHQAASGGFGILGRVGMENLPREFGNTLGLRMNGGAIRFSGGSYALPEQIPANNFQIHPSYKPDNRLMAYQDGYQFPK